MRSRGGTLRAQWLGKLMRDLRESAGLDLKDAGDHLMRDPSTISRMEVGTTPARVVDLRELLNLYRVDDPDLRAALETIARDIWLKDWWDDYTRNVHVRVIDLAWLESCAEKLRSFSLSVIHGLLQTREYAEAVMRANAPSRPIEQVSRWLDFRMKRQDVLDRLDFTVILDEYVLHRPFGGARVMRDQLVHLLGVSDRPNVTVRVLPFADSSLIGSEGAFALFTMPSPFPVVAQVPTEAGTIYVEMAKAARLEASYNRLESQALDPEESRVFIKSRMEQFT